MLNVSRNMSLIELSTSMFLKETFNRYRRYLAYINFEGYYGEILSIVINDYLTHERIPTNGMVLAAKCVTIDIDISRLLDGVYTEAEEDCDDFDY